MQNISLLNARKCIKIVENELQLDDAIIVVSLGYHQVPLGISLEELVLSSVTMECSCSDDSHLPARHRSLCLC